MEVRPNLKPMSVTDLIILRHVVADSTDKTDIEFKNEIDQELKNREDK